MLKFALAFALATLPCQAQEAIPGPLQALVTGVYDGDTMTVRVRTWIGQTVEAHVRVVGVDTPEIRGGCREEIQLARQARASTAEWIGKIVVLSEIRPDKYGNRVLARVTANGEDLAERLIRLGLGRPYGGGRRLGWCGNG